MTVAVEGSTDIKPSGVSNVAVKVSSPSRARVSSSIAKLTQALVDPAGNEAVSGLSMNSVPLSAAFTENKQDKCQINLYNNYFLYTIHALRRKLESDKILNQDWPFNY